MTRETTHRIMVNGSPRVLRLTGVDSYRHPLNKKLLAGRVDPAKVVATQFHYLFAKYGPANVAKMYLGVNLGICTAAELEARPEWIDTNDVFRSAKSKPQTLRNQPNYVGTDIVLLVPEASPVISQTDVNRLMDFVATFYYVLDHFPTATEASIRDPNRWKLWLGFFVAGCATEGAVLMAEMADHIQSLDLTMSKWYPRR
jgi:hypothetical protein